MSSKLPSCQKDGDFQCLLTRKYLYYITRSQNCKQVVANAKFLKCISLAFFRTTYLHNLLTRCRRMASSPYLTYNLFAKRVVLKAQVVTQEPPKREKSRQATDKHIVFEKRRKATSSAFSQLEKLLSLQHAKNNVQKIALW